VKSQITIKLTGILKNIEKYFGWIYYMNIVLVLEKNQIYFRRRSQIQRSKICLVFYFKNFRRKVKWRI
jgi:hypothetical protein